MSELPINWEKARFDELNQYASKTVIPVNFPDEIFELYSVPSFPTGMPEMLNGLSIGSSKQLVEPGDVLVCKINPRINRVWQVRQKKDLKQIASSEWIVMRTDKVDVRFLCHYFSSPDFRNLICQDLTGVGAGQSRLKVLENRI